MCVGFCEAIEVSPLLLSDTLSFCCVFVKPKGADRKHKRDREKIDRCSVMDKVGNYGTVIDSNDFLIRLRLLVFICSRLQLLRTFEILVNS